MSEAAFSALKTLRDLDPERYLACLYLPEQVREDIATLWAFDAEIARIPYLVSEPMPGEIRIQWWRDLIKSGDNVDAGPLAAKLVDVIGRHSLPRETFDNYLQARIFDLYQDAMPDTGSFEGYLGETISIFFQYAGTILGAERSTLLADASGHAGMAVGIARLLAGNARHRARGQVFLPLDLLEKHGLGRETWLDEEIFEEHLAVLDEMVRTANYHLTFVRKVLEELTKAQRAAFLPLGMVDPLLKAVNSRRIGSFTSPVSIHPLKRNWHMLRAAMRQIP